MCSLSRRVQGLTRPPRTMDDDIPAIVVLVARCTELAARAGAVIRHVQRDREEEGGTAALGATLKDAGDTRSYLTKADTQAQHVIVEGLRHSFPSLTIIGEEDDDACASSAASATADLLSTSISGVGGVQTEEAFGVADVPPELRDVKVEDLVVFIDPVDGTREFVEGRLGSVVTLIGIALRGRAIAGVVGVPFHDGKIGVVGDGSGQLSGARGLVLHAVVGAGVYGLTCAQGGEANEGWCTRPEGHPGLVMATSKKIKEPIVQKANAMLGGVGIVAGGCGNKILRLVTGQADVCLFNLGTSLWDTCATEASSCV